MPKASKGSAFEREFSKKLSLWWSDNQADDWFWRTAGSGGRATNRGKQGKTTANAAGDICACNAEAEKLLKVITFELKRGYSSLSIQDLLDHGNPNNQFQQFIDQARASADLAGGTSWALVLRRDRRETLVFTPIAPTNGWGDSPVLQYDWGFHRPYEINHRFYMVRLGDFLSRAMRNTLKMFIDGESGHENVSESLEPIPEITSTHDSRFRNGKTK